MAAVKKEPDAFWEQMVNNELAAKKHCLLRLSGAGKRVRQQKLAAYIFPCRNLSLTVDADPQAEISSKETLAENLTSLTLSNGAGLFWQNPRVKSKSYKLLPYRIKAI